MARKLLFLNILLLAGVVLLGLRLIYGWQSFQEDHSPQELFAQAQTQGAALPDYEPQGLDNPAFVDYSVVVDRNLFSEDRRPPTGGEEELAADLPPEIPREPLLHGVARIGNYTVAQITKFDARSPQGSRVQVSEGDELHGWTVAEIDTGSMILRWKEHEREILKTVTPRQQAAARTASSGGVRIITIGSRSAAVETVTSAATESEDQGGLQVAAVGQQQGARGNSQTRGTQQQGQGQGLTGRQNTRGTAGATNSRLRNNRLQSNRPIQQGRPPR